MKVTIVLVLLPMINGHCKRNVCRTCEKLQGRGHHPRICKRLQKCCENYRYDTYSLWPDQGRNDELEQNVGLACVLLFVLAVGFFVVMYAIRSFVTGRKTRQFKLESIRRSSVISNYETDNSSDDEETSNAETGSEQSGLRRQTIALETLLAYNDKGI